VKADNPSKNSGVYKGDVEVKLPDGTLLEKPSTFFPDSWTRESLVDAIETALTNKGTGTLSNNGEAMIFSGISKSGFPITIVEDLNGNLLTAYRDVTWTP